MDNSAQEFLGPRRTHDLVDMLLGDRLGSGEFRDVYACPIWTDHVIKVEKIESQRKRRFANVDEWAMWCEFMKTPWKKWFAPVWSISESGLILFQSRCTPLLQPPKQVPSFFADLKMSNWGMLKGRPVCFDYSNHNCFDMSKKQSKLVTVKWNP